MFRACVSLLALAPLLVIAAPVPKHKESAEQKLKRVFGEKVEPEGMSVKLEGTPSV